MNHLTIEIKPGKSFNSVTLKISDGITTVFYSCSQDLAIGTTIGQAMKAFMNQKTEDMLQAWRNDNYEVPF